MMMRLWLHSDALSYISDASKTNFDVYSPTLFFSVYSVWICKSTLWIDEHLQAIHLVNNETVKKGCTQKAWNLAPQINWAAKLLVLIYLWGW